MTGPQQSQTGQQPCIPLAVKVYELGHCSEGMAVGNIVLAVVIRKDAAVPVLALAQRQRVMAGH